MVSRTSSRIVVDLLFYTGLRGGTETYVRQVLPRVARLAPEFEFVGLTNRAGHDAITAWFPGPLRTLPLSGHDQRSWAAAEALAVAPLARRLGADLIWAPANFGPGSGTVPLLLTLHDTIPFDFPNPNAGLLRRALSPLMIRRAALKATHVMTDSQDSAMSIARVLGISRDRITSTPLAGGNPQPSLDTQSELQSIGVSSDRPVVFSTGNRMPHKNFAGLVRAMAEMPAGIRPLLAVTGSHGLDPLLPLVKSLGLVDDVCLLGWVTTPQLEALYATASLYVCPSLAEGFGLPVLDAMTRGCPVLANDVPVLREVGGSAARYVNALDARALGAAIANLLSDSDQRVAMRDAGLARSRTFSWDRTAEQTVNVMRVVLAGH